MTRFRLCLLLLCLSAVPALAQLPAGVTPQMVAQFEQMSPAQQQLIANQLGMDLAQLRQQVANARNQTSSGLGTAQQPLVPGQGQGQQGQGQFQGQLGMGAAQSGMQGQPGTWGAQQGQGTRGMQPGLEAEDDADTDVFMKRLPLFGSAIFDAAISTFVPVDNAPVPAEYILGPGDSLTVQLYGNQNQTLNLEVDRLGTVNFPELGPIAVAGLSFTAAQDILLNRINEEMIGVRAAISLGRLRAINIFLAGEAANPGTYAVSALTTVTQALFVAGGISEIGSLRNIQIRRAGQPAASFDLYDLLLEGDASSDVRLQSGDVVFIPPVGPVAQIDGAVRRPAAYELRSGETLADLVRMAGGFQANAFTQDVLMRRYSDNGMQQLSSLNFRQAGAGELALRDGDGLLVSESSVYIQDRITVRGAVTRPGPRGWRPGLRVSQVFGSVITDLTANDVDLNYALVVRVRNAERDIDVIQFNLGEAILNPDSAANIELQAEDELLVFDLPSVSSTQEVETDRQISDFALRGFADARMLNRQEPLQLSAQEAEGEEEPVSNRQELLEPVLEKLRLQADRQEPVRIVTINGNVKAPGDYPLTVNMNVGQLIRAAGGLQDSAVEDAELLRLREVLGAQVEVEQIPLELNTRNPNLSDDDLLLQSRDTVMIRTISDWSLNEQVTLTGQVRFPGTYTVVPGERLGDVIRRAGGLKEDAFVEGAIFTRDILKEREAQQAREFARSIRDTYAARSMTQEVMSTSFDDINLVASYFEEYEGMGRMVINLGRIIAGDSAADIELLAGDQLHLPRRPESVTVVGAVFHEGSHRYNPTLTLRDYMELSGGADQRAREQDIYVLKADGSVLVPARNRSLFRFASAENRIGPGDTVIVPVDTAFKDRLTFIKDITQISYQAGVGLAAILAAF